MDDKMPVWLKGLAWLIALAPFLYLAFDWLKNRRRPR
jgi:hypothetical protein